MRFTLEFPFFAIVGILWLVGDEEEFCGGVFEVDLVSFQLFIIGKKVQKHTTIMVKLLVTYLYSYNL